jgi:cytochrome c oxidase subunit IV
VNNDGILDLILGGNQYEFKPQFSRLDSNYGSVLLGSKSGTFSWLPKSNIGRIWKVFGILSAVTIVEVYLGILKPDFLFMNDFLSMNLLNWIFYALTVFKAYYIVYAFMHMEGEKSSLRSAVVFPVIFLILYLLFILLTEGDYIYEVFKNSTIKWNF